MKKRIAKKIVGYLVRKFDLIESVNTLSETNEFKSIEIAKRPYLNQMYYGMIKNSMVDGAFFLKKHIESW